MPINLRAGQQVRIEVARVGRVEGRLVIADDSALTLDRSAGPVQVRLLDIERLWVRGHSAGKGATIGAVVGVLAGVAGGLLLSTVACEPVDGGDCTAAEVAVVTGVLGGAGGAIVGAGIGLAIPVWRLRFP
ncbi:MAG: hypothetical protein E4H38_08500 [Gemmatimonadales bacterium]|nr:MAG: hypothetical protein E4H38_08500 [Gemmatimonadales bacterium]